MSPVQRYKLPEDMTAVTFHLLFQYAVCLPRDRLLIVCCIDGIVGAVIEVPTFLCRSLRTIISPRFVVYLANHTVVDDEANSCRLSAEAHRAVLGEHSETVRGFTIGKRCHSI